MLEALLVYQKIDVDKKIAEMGKNKKVAAEAGEQKMQGARTLNVKELEKELAQNKKLIAMTAGDEDADGDEGSDSEPSEDNLSEDEMAKIIPIAPKPEPEKPKVGSGKSKKEPAKRRNSKTNLDATPNGGSSQQKQRPVPAPKVASQSSRSPMKRIM